MSRLVDVQIKKLHEDAVIPMYAHDGDAGFDLVTICDTIIDPKQTVAVKTGLAMAIPNGYEIQIRPRSGISLKGVDTQLLKMETEIDESGMVVAIAYTKDGKIYLRVQLGTIDCQYRGEIGIITYNQSDETVIIPKGTRLAQGVLNEIPQAKWNVVDELSSTERGEGGYGSTGVK